MPRNYHPVPRKMCRYRLSRKEPYCVFHFSLKVFKPQTLFQTCISFHKDANSDLITGLDLRWRLIKLPIMETFLLGGRWPLRVDLLYTRVFLGGEKHSARQIHQDNLDKMYNYISC